MKLPPFCCMRLARYFALAAILFLPIFLVAQTTVPPILLGAAWYPEQWTEAQQETDLTLMQQAGIHVVRVAEFSWSRIEPIEGQYDFDWLDHAIAAAAKHGIVTVLGTPTAAPPAWLTEKYPEVLRVDEDGHRAEHGTHFAGLVGLSTVILGREIPAIPAKSSHVSVSPFSPSASVSLLTKCASYRRLAHPSRRFVHTDREDLRI